MIDAFTLNDARQTRLSVLAEFEQKMDGLKHEEKKLAAKLMQAAPAAACKFLRNEEIIPELLRHGLSSRKIYYKKNPYKMFDDRAAIKFFTSLETAWNGAVKILFDGYDDYIQVEIVAT